MPDPLEWNPSRPRQYKGPLKFITYKKQFWESKFQVNCLLEGKHRGLAAYVI